MHHLFLYCRGSTAAEAAQNVIDVQIPALKDLCASGSLYIDNIDVFCEKGVFDTDTSRRILKAGKEAGWKINFHGDELHPMNSGEVRGHCLCVWVIGIIITTCDFDDPYQNENSCTLVSLSPSLSHTHTHPHTHTHTVSCRVRSACCKSS